ncbi:hypothetical protein E2C01_056861 [Portunus trituberculatus]|uniref:Uncharacterized protein n=1 Tax=Portunus trituberculatus TaxID=210409 RepID=A0A5B7GRH5_PORTR|nr:hypothetical protein [Portunus trituberculatus]
MVSSHQPLSPYTGHPSYHTSHNSTSVTTFVYPLFPCLLEIASPLTCNHMLFQFSAPDAVPVLYCYSTRCSSFFTPLFSGSSLHAVFQLHSSVSYD